MKVSISAFENKHCVTISVIPAVERIFTHLQSFRTPLLPSDVYLTLDITVMNLSLLPGQWNGIQKLKSSCSFIILRKNSKNFEFLSIFPPLWSWIWQINIRKSLACLRGKLQKNKVQSVKLHYSLLWPPALSGSNTDNMDQKTQCVLTEECLYSLQCKSEGSGQSSSQHISCKKRTDNKDNKKEKKSPTVLLLTGRGLTFKVFNKVLITFDTYLLRAQNM